jgi:hypothetical protein
MSGASVRTSGPGPSTIRASASSARWSYRRPPWACGHDGSTTRPSAASVTSDMGRASLTAAFRCGWRAIGSRFRISRSERPTLPGSKRMTTASPVSRFGRRWQPPTISYGHMHGPGGSLGPARWIGVHRYAGLLARQGRNRGLISWRAGSPARFVILWQWLRPKDATNKVSSEPLAAVVAPAGLAW